MKFIKIITSSFFGVLVYTPSFFIIYLDETLYEWGPKDETVAFIIAANTILIYIFRRFIFYSEEKLHSSKVSDSREKNYPRLVNTFIIATSVSYICLGLVYFLGDYAINTLPLNPRGLFLIFSAWAIFHVSNRYRYTNIESLLYLAIVFINTMFVYNYVLDIV